jgi:hypothetical protein
MPGVRLQSPIRDLIPIESSAGPSQDKGKGRAVEAMDEGKLERERSVSLTVSEYEGAFHGGDSCFVYNWIDDAHHWGRGYLDFSGNMLSTLQALRHFAQHLPSRSILFTFGM